MSFEGRGAVAEMHNEAPSFKWKCILTKAIPMCGLDMQIENTLCHKGIQGTEDVLNAIS